MDGRPTSVYLDHAATSPLHPQVWKRIEPFLKSRFGNPHSPHAYGRAAYAEVEKARQFVSKAVEGRDWEVVFTSGATEAINLFIRGTCSRRPRHRDCLVVSQVEHPAVLQTMRRVAREEGMELHEAPVDADGQVKLPDLDQRITERTFLVCVMCANNETGVIQPIHEIGRICGRKNAMLMVDTVQSMGKIPCAADSWGAHAVVVSGHKMGAPQGVGALVLQKGLDCKPQITGGSQERKVRAGTLNVPGIVGLGAACELAIADKLWDVEVLKSCRDELESRIAARIPSVRINGQGAPRLPQVSNICFRGVDGESLLNFLDSRGVMVSTGSACASGSLKASHVLRAMGQSIADAGSALRFSFGTGNDLSQVIRVVDLVEEGILRSC